jgi:hypothetical protein
VNANFLRLLHEQLENAYRDKGPEAVAEGIGYYVLLRSIEVFDRDETHIAPLLARCCYLSTSLPLHLSIPLHCV